MRKPMEENKGKRLSEILGVIEDDVWHVRGYEANRTFRVHQGRLESALDRDEFEAYFDSELLTKIVNDPSQIYNTFDFNETEMGIIRILWDNGLEEITRVAYNPASLLIRKSIKPTLTDRENHDRLLEQWWMPSFFLPTIWIGDTIKIINVLYEGKRFCPYCGSVLAPAKAADVDWTCPNCERHFHHDQSADESGYVECEVTKRKDPC